MSNPFNLLLQTPTEYRADGRDSVFRSPEALRWMIRKHRGEYVAADALVYPTNRPLIVPEKFDQVTLAIGERNARSRTGQ